MDASALASALDNFERSWSALDWWLNFWTILVVIGVAVELVVLVTEYMHDWRDFRRGTIHSPDKPSLVVFGLGFLGAGLVAIGVAGELRIHIKAGKIETDIRNTTRKLVALVEREAANANAEAARLTNENLVLQAEVLKLREKMADRHLSDEQQKNIAAKLKPFGGTRINLFVFSNAGDEALNLGKELLNVLTGKDGAGWMVSASLADEPGLVVPGIGVEVQQNADDRSKEASKVLLKALTDERLSAGFVPALPPGNSRMKAGALKEDPLAMIRLIVGKKP